MTQVMFDLDVMRSFSTGVSLGSFARAADRLGRSTSAVSAQLKKLEQQAGTPLFRKAGRGLELTDAGHTLLAYAHRLLDINDEAAAAMRGADLQGWIRIGMQENVGESLLPAVLGRFSRAHPKVRIEACMARSAELRGRMQLGQLDLMLVWEIKGAPGAAALPNGERLVRLPLHWLGPADPDSLDAPWWSQRRAGQAAEPLPLVLLDASCPLRETVTTTLDRAGVAWRHAFTSTSLSALWAASSVGLGLSALTAFGLPPHVRPLDRELLGLPALPPMTLAMYRAQAEPEPAVARLAELMREAVREGLKD